MTSTISKGLQKSALLLLVFTLAACQVPRSGPTKKEILSGGIAQNGDAHIFHLDIAVAQAAHLEDSFGFPKAFVSAKTVGADEIFAGDVLTIGIFENVRDEPLLGNTGQRVSVLEQIQVEGDGYIFVPYAGRIKAAGETPDSLRRVLVARLEQQTPDPQITVQRKAGLGAMVSVMGFVGGSGIYPIEHATRNLAAILAKAGGVAIAPETALIRVTRNGVTGVLPLQDIYANPSYDIALRAGDKIVVERDTRAFVVMGATGAQARIPFDARNVSLLEALAHVGGLNSALADPKSVFVFRSEDPLVLKALTGQDVTQKARAIYVLDLTEPNGIFVARAFDLRADDTVYVGEAPFVLSQKALSTITGTASGLNSSISIANTVSGK